MLFCQLCWTLFPLLFEKLYNKIIINTAIFHVLIKVDKTKENIIKTVVYKEYNTSLYRTSFFFQINRQFYRKTYLR